MSSSNVEKKHTAFIRSAIAVLNNPFTGIIIGAIITIAVSHYYEHKPRISYSVIKSNMIANAEVNPKLIITYEGDTVKKVNLVEFSFWNDGNTYIDSAAISTAKELSINVSNAVRILSVAIKTKSRDNLVFNSFDSVENKTTNIIPLKIKGDDGLEPCDGAVFNILYAGDTNIVWSMDGHLKGVPNGIIKTNPKSIANLGKSPLWLFIAIIAVFFALLIGLVKYVKNPKNKKDKGFRGTVIMYAVFLFLVSLLLYTISYNQIYYGDNLNWLIKQ
jgi:hypothetical protein